MLSRSGCPVSAELCISCRILICSSSESGIQHLSLKRSLPFMLRKHFNMETLTSISAEKICCPSHIIMINLIKALSCFLTSFHYFFISSSIDGSNSMILLFFLWNSDFTVLLLFFWDFDFIILISFKKLSIKIFCWQD